MDQLNKQLQAASRAADVASNSAEGTVRKAAEQVRSVHSIPGFGMHSTEVSIFVQFVCNEGTVGRAEPRPGFNAGRQGGGCP